MTLRLSGIKVLMYKNKDSICKWFSKNKKAPPPLEAIVMMNTVPEPAELLANSKFIYLFIRNIVN